MYITPVWAHTILARKAYAGLSQILGEESKARSGKGLEVEALSLNLRILMPSPGLFRLQYCSFQILCVS